MIVDDEQPNLDMVRRILVGATLSVLTATDVREARRIVDAQDVDVVLSDVYLKGPSGLELVRHLQELRPLMPVILMSGAVTPDLTRDAAEAGAYDILAKPFEPGELLLTLARAVRQAGRVV